MEISGALKEKGTAFMAVVTLVIIGCSLLASTWQNMLQQKAAEEQHLFFISHAVLLAVESSLRRAPIKKSANSLSPRTAEIFEALEEDGEILFTGILDQRGEQLLMAQTRKGNEISLPPTILENLLQSGEWHGEINLEGKNAYVSGKLLAPIRGQILTLSESPRAPMFLLVGIETGKYLNIHEGFRKNIILQAGYILAAALLSWFFAFSFFTRKAQSQRVEKFHSKLLDNLPDGLITLNAHHLIVSANPSVLSVFGMEASSLVGKSIADLPGVFFDSITAQCSMPTTNSWQRISSERRQFEILVLPLYDDEEVFMVIIRDRTKLRQLEQSLAEAEKLASVGTLAAGVAHEVRNPLSALRGFSQYFLKKLAGTHPEEEYARTMVTEADRLNRVISDLLFLAKPKKIHPKVVDLRCMVDEITNLLRFDLEQKKMSIKADLAALFLLADEDALKQLLLNLVLNSLDAISVPCLPIVIASGKEENTVWLEVRDNGCGMTEEQKNKAFDPFFTAKPRGTGLGLALVHGIMVDHGGTAQIISEVGKGCILRLVFPADETLDEQYLAKGTVANAYNVHETSQAQKAPRSLMHEESNE